jgi:hypothetical protein
VASAARVPDRLFVLETASARLTALDAETGAQLGAAQLNSTPTAVCHDPRRNRLYVLTSGGVLALDPERLDVLGLWASPRPLGRGAGMALDARRGLLYVAQPGEGMVARVDIATMTSGAPLALGADPGPLALSSDGRTLYGIDLADGALWSLALPGGAATTYPLGLAEPGRGAWLAVSDGVLYAMRGAVPSRATGTAEPPAIWRLDTRGALSRPLPVAAAPTPQDLVALGGDRLALARGDGQLGGVELLAAESAAIIGRIDPPHDLHRLVAGEGGALFALNWRLGIAARYDLASGREEWRVTLGGEPRDAVFIPGGWRLPRWW